MAEESHNDTPTDEIHAIPLGELEVVTLPELIDLSSHAQIIEGTVLVTIKSYLPDMGKGYTSIPPDLNPSPELDEEYP